MVMYTKRIFAFIRRDKRFFFPFLYCKRKYIRMSNLLLHTRRRCLSNFSSEKTKTVWRFYLSKMQSLWWWHHITMAAVDYFFRPADIVLLAKYDDRYYYMIKHISVGRELCSSFFAWDQLWWGTAESTDSNVTVTLLLLHLVWVIQ